MVSCFRSRHSRLLVVVVVPLGILLIDTKLFTFRSHFLLFIVVLCSRIAAVSSNEIAMPKKSMDNHKKRARKSYIVAATNTRNPRSHLGMQGR